MTGSLDRDAVIETSGSTGRPKRVLLPASAIRASAEAARAALGADGGWTLALPERFAAGLNVLARAELMGAPPVRVEGESFTAGAFARATAALPEGPAYTSLVPVQLARLVAEAEGREALLRYDRILLGSQAPDPQLVDRARGLGARITVTYGMTETCGGCVWDGAPIGDVSVAIRDGLVHLAGSVLAAGYEGEPELTAEAFPMVGGVRMHRTQDLGRLESGRLVVTGRVDDVIVSGGVKVSLGEVQAIVRALPGLGDAVAVAVDRPDWGAVPAVVTSGAADAEAVRAAVGSALGPAARPAVVLAATAIPLLPTGKPDRAAAAALAAAADRRVP